MRVGLLEPKDDAELVDFLDKLGASSDGEMVVGYYYPEYRDMLLEVLRPGIKACYLAARSPGGQMLAVLPGMIRTSGDLACYNSLPFFGAYTGVLAAVENSAEYACLANILLGAAVEQARACGAITAAFYSVFNPRNLPLPRPDYEAFGRVETVPRFLQFLSFPDARMPQWPSHIRYDLRKAARSGLRVTAGLDDSDVDQMFQIYAQNCEDYGIPAKPKECVQYLCLHGGKRVGSYGAYLDDRMIAGLLVLAGPKTVDYYLPCSEHQHRSLQANTLLIDRACRDATARDVRYWNWEGSPSRDSGVFRFKKRWGAEEASYEVAVVCLGDISRLRSLGREELAARFPFFFVYPYDRL